MKFLRINQKLKRILPIIGGVLIADQLTKLAVLWAITKGQVIYVTSFFNLVLTFNTGVSFSLFQSNGMLGLWLLISIAIGLCLWLCVLIKQSHDKNEQIAFSVIIGGAIGNITDRFLYGGVVDFLDFHIKKHHWPAFNIADSAIVVGAVIILCAQLWHSFQNNAKRTSNIRNKSPKQRDR